MSDQLSLLDGVPEHPAERLRRYAASGIKTDSAERLLELAAVVGELRLEFSAEHTVASWQIRLDMIAAGQSDGTEKTVAMGSLASRCAWVRASAMPSRVPETIPAEYDRYTEPLTRQRMQAVLDKAHGNYNSTWRRPTADERAQQAARAQEVQQSRSRRKTGRAA